jgi:hypothetical protein
MRSARTARQFILRGFVSIAPCSSEHWPAFQSGYPANSGGNPLVVAACRCVTLSRERIDSTPLCAIAFGCQASFFWHHILWPSDLRRL